MMKRESMLAASLALALLFAGLGATVAPAAQQQQQYGALERGWRTGYSDGYQAGWRDSLERRESDYRGKEEYRRGDRAYVAAYGPVEEYRDGYRQGFESGYGEGYARRGFSSELPAGGIQRRGDGAPQQSAETADPSRPQLGTARDDDDEEAARGADPGRTAAGASAGAAIPRDTVLRVELLNRLSTDVSQRGDRFEARVVEPQEYEGAIVGGRVAEVQRPGKVRGRAELQLDFDQIRMPDGEWADFHAQVVEVINMGASGGGDDAEGEVDPEGGVRGRGTTKEDAMKVGAASGIGAIIGAIAGGGKGAIVGAVIGAGVGTGGVMTQRGRDIRFERGQQLRIRTSGR